MQLFREKTPEKQLLDGAMSSIEEMLAGLARGADIESENKEGLTALAICQNPDAGDQLLKRGAQIDRQMGPKKITTLMYTISRKNYQYTRWLLRKGADPEVRDAEGKSALDYAVKYKYMIDDIEEAIKDKRAQQETAAAAQRPAQVTQVQFTHELGAGVTLVEVYDFKARERISVSCTHSAVSPPVREPFREISQSALFNAAAEFRKKGGVISDTELALLSVAPRKALPLKPD